MGRAGVSAIACFALVLVLTVGFRAVAAISCGQVVAALIPCINYAQAGGNIPPACCSGVRSVVAASKAPEDLKISCGCLKQMVASVPGVKYDLVNNIPGKCGTSLPWQISPFLDCSKVHW